MSSVRGYDNLYSDSVNDIALMNYNKGIANRLRMQEMEMQNKLPFKEPKLLGGVRYSESILPGTSIEAVPRAVGGRAFRTFTGNETPIQGGKVNRLKKSNRYLDFSKKVVGDAFNIYDEAKKRGAGSGGVNRLKKANRYLDFSKKVVGDAFNIYDEAKKRGAGSGGVNRLKKANRYLDFSKKVVGDAFNIYDQAKARGGMVYSPELKKALGGCGDCSGGVKPKKTRKARFVKGSAKAKAWGEKMKLARMKKM